MTSEVVVRDESSVAKRPTQDIDRLRQAISEITTVEQVVDATSVISGLKAYARARQSLDLVNEAVELRIWAERKGGEAIVRNGDKISTLRKHGIYPQDANRWLVLYLIDKKFIEEHIASVKAAQRQLNVLNLVHAGKEAGRKRVAAGVFKEVNGTFSIEWKEMGRKHHGTGYKTREKAVAAVEQRKRLAPKVERWKQTEAQNALAKAYALLRRTLDSAHMAPSSPTMNECLEYLYKAEDLMTKASKQA